MPVFPSQGGSKNTWGTELRNFFSPLFDLATGARVSGQIVSADIADGTIVNADISAGAAIVDTKLATIATANKISDTALNIPNVKFMGTYADFATAVSTIGAAVTALIASEAEVVASSLAIPATLYLDLKGLGTITASVGAIITLNSVIRGDRRTQNKITAQMLLGSDASLFDITVESSEVASRVLKLVAGASRVLVDGSVLNAPDGYTISMDMNTSTKDLSFISNRMNAEGYCVLLNNAGIASPGGSRLRIQNNFLTSLDADAVEINTPDGVANGVIISGNFAETTAVSPGATGAGFVFGLSNCINWVLFGNVAFDSRREVVHVEGIQKGGLIVANSLSGELGGILAFGETGGLPYPIVANNITSLTVGSNSGIEIKLASPASPNNGMPLIGNVVVGYLVGIKIFSTLSATLAHVTIADGNSMDNCTTALNLIGAEGVAANRQIGDNFARGATNLFATTAHASMGGMYSDVKPTKIINNAGYGGFMPSSVDKFGYPIASKVIIIGLNTIALFPAAATQRFHGRVRFRGRRNGVADWIYDSATLTWNGTTLTIADQVGRVSTPGITFTVPTWVVTGANDLAFRFTSSANTTFSFNWCEFDGEYWDS